MKIREYNSRELTELAHTLSMTVASHEIFIQIIQDILEDAGVAHRGEIINKFKEKYEAFITKYEQELESHVRKEQEMRKAVFQALAETRPEGNS